MATGRVMRFGQAILGSSNTLIYTCPSSRAAILRDLAVCNNDSGSRTYSLHFVKTGESVADANAVVKTRSIASKVTDAYRFNLPMVTGDKIYAVADVGALLSLQASGTEYEGTLAPFVPTRLVQAVCTGSSVTVYTVPASTRAIIKDLLICNLGSGTPTFTIDLVPSGGSVSSTTKWYNAYALTANQHLHLRVSAVLEAGDTIRILASTTSAVAINVHGAEWTVS
ncbi:MAG: hypothetical protein IPH55_19730 [Betaproteobacteria bacterium]|nr:hypothetical protein [Betaproteobacteria bacterium]